MEQNMALFSETHMITLGVQNQTRGTVDYLNSPRNTFFTSQSGLLESQSIAVTNFKDLNRQHEQNQVEKVLQDEAKIEEIASEKQEEEERKAKDEEFKQPCFLNSLPPKIQLAYSNFKFINETEYCRTFEATSVTHNEIHTIRVLNFESSFYLAEPNRASTLFVQELLRLCITSPKAIFIETFEFNGSQIAYALKYCQTLQQLHDSKINPNNMNLDKLLTDISSDMLFLLSKLNVSIINVKLQSINYIASVDSFFLSNWETNKPKIDYKKGPFLDSKHQVISNEAEEVYSLGMGILELHGIPKDELEDLQSLSNIYMYNGALHETLAMLKLPLEIENKVKRMLMRDSNERMRLGELANELTDPRSDYNYYERQDFGTMKVPYIKSLNKDGHLIVAINAMQEYGGKSLEELRTEDYQSLKRFPEMKNSLPPKVQSNNSISGLPMQTATANTSTARRQTCRSLEECLNYPNPLEVAVINLSSNDLIALEDYGVSKLSSNTSWRNLKILNLHDNHLSWYGGTLLAANNTWTNLTTLDLSSNKIRDWGAKALSESKSWPLLIKLNLSNNNIKSEGAAALSANTSWTNLTILNLSHNKIGDQGAAALSKNSSWTILATLELRNNGITGNGATALSKNISWTNITTLKLSENQNTGSAAACIKKRWPELFYHFKGDFY